MLNSNILTNSAGLSFDYNNLYGENKVTENDLMSIKDKVQRAHIAIQNMRETGFLTNNPFEEKVLFSQLPFVVENNINSPKSIAKLISFGNDVCNKVHAIVSFGTGGSFLGNKVLFDAICGEFWNLDDAKYRNGCPELYFAGNNIDGEQSMLLLNNIVRQAKDYKLSSTDKKYIVKLIIISKSGSTLEPLASFMWFFDELNKYSDILDVKVVAITSCEKKCNETTLYKLAVKNSWPLFDVPDGVGGRFSIFSEACLVTAVATGLDINEFLAGARAMDESCRSENVFENMALLNATLKYIAAEKYNRDIEVFMPYSSRLKSLSDWYVQLLAESLGKTKNRKGENVYYGRTPIASVGTTDMHAQTQQHQEGKNDKVVQFVKIKKWNKDPKIPNIFPKEKQLANLSGIAFSDVMNAALEANATALLSNNRFNATFELPELNLYYLGGLMYLLMLSIAYEGELADVNAFDQPGVEAYKKILKIKLENLK